MHAACCCTAGDRRPVLFTPVYHRPAGNPIPNLPAIAMECWDFSMSTCPLCRMAFLSVSPFLLPVFTSAPCFPFLSCRLCIPPSLSGLDCKLLEGRDRVFSPLLCTAPARTSTCLFKKS